LLAWPDLDDAGVYDLHWKLPLLFPQLYSLLPIPETSRATEISRAFPDFLADTQAEVIFTTSYELRLSNKPMVY
jgi:hypothetical protein